MYTRVVIQKVDKFDNYYLKDEEIWRELFSFRVS